MLVPRGIAGFLEGARTTGPRQSVQAARQMLAGWTDRPDRRQAR